MLLSGAKQLVLAVEFGWAPWPYRVARDPRFHGFYSPVRSNYPKLMLTPDVRKSGKPTSSTPCHETLGLPYATKGQVRIGGWLSGGLWLLLAAAVCVGCSCLEDGVQPV